MVPSNGFPFHLRAAANFGFCSNLAAPSKAEHRWWRLGGFQQISKHTGQSCTLRSFLWKTLGMLCSATATGGDGSFPSHPPALPLLRCPSLLAVLPPSHPTSLILYHTAQWSPEEPEPIISITFSLEGAWQPEKTPDNHDATTITSNCVSCHGCSDNAAMSPVTGLTGDSPVPRTAHITKDCYK